jgi:hypothetical protein
MNWIDLSANTLLVVPMDRQGAYLPGKACDLQCWFPNMTQGGRLAASVSI